jgi:hypothetical protein
VNPSPMGRVRTPRQGTGTSSLNSFPPEIITESTKTPSCCSLLQIPSSMPGRSLGRETRLRLSSPRFGRALCSPRPTDPGVGWAGKGNDHNGRTILNPLPDKTFPTPQLPEYISGHSTFSAAGAAVLKLFTGSDVFGSSVTLAAGSSKIELGLTPSNPVTLRWRAFTEAANEAGISRRYGGIHFKAGDLTGRAVGRVVGYQAWIKAEALWSGRKGGLKRHVNDLLDGTLTNADQWDLVREPEVFRSALNLRPALHKQTAQELTIRPCAGDPLVCATAGTEAFASTPRSSPRSGSRRRHRCRECCRRGRPRSICNWSAVPGAHACHTG